MTGLSTTVIGLVFLPRRSLTVNATASVRRAWHAKAGSDDRSERAGIRCARAVAVM